MKGRLALTNVNVHGDAENMAINVDAARSGRFELRHHGQCGTEPTVTLSPTEALDTNARVLSTASSQWLNQLATQVAAHDRPVYSSEHRILRVFIDEGDFAPSRTASREDCLTRSHLNS
jgi:hypothetical protein